MAVLGLLKGQKERVTWALISLAILEWTYQQGQEIGELRAKVGYQEQALEMVSAQLEECDGMR